VLGLFDQRKIGFREHLHHLRVRLAAFDDDKVSLLEGFRRAEDDLSVEVFDIDRQENEIALRQVCDSLKAADGLKPLHSMGSG